MERTLLLVEDEPLIAVNEAEKLINMGYQVHTAYSGEKALAWVQADPEGVDLVILDINLDGKMDGIDTARRIAAVRDVPVIFLSSHTEKEVVEKTEEVSSYGYVVKNSGVYVLEAAIKRAFVLREKEEELKRSEARFRTYFDLPHVGLSITSPGKYWLEVNDKLCSMLGYSRDELMTKTWAELTYPEDLPADEKVFHELIAGEREFYTLDKRYVRKDGGLIWASIAVSCVRDASGDIDFVVATIQDISERKELETNLRKTAEQREFLMREMQHRIKNNLAVISSLLRLEMEKSGDKAVQDVFLRAISRINSMSEVYNKLRHVKDSSRIDFPNYVRALANSLVETYKRDTVNIRFECGFDRLQLDSQQAVLFGIIINELVTNAVKHAYPGNAGGDIDISLWEEAGTFFLRVADYGAGLPTGTSGDTSGGGLGLRLVQTLAEQLEGNCTVDTGGGTAVTVSIAVGKLSI